MQEQLIEDSTFMDKAYNTQFAAADSMLSGEW